MEVRSRFVGPFCSVVFYNGHDARQLPRSFGADVARISSLSGVLCVRHTMLSERRQYAEASQEDAEVNRPGNPGGSVV